MSRRTKYANGESNLVEAPEWGVWYLCPITREKRMYDVSSFELLHRYAPRRSELRIDCKACKQTHAITIDPNDPVSP